MHMNFVIFIWIYKTSLYLNFCNKMYPCVHSSEKKISQLEVAFRGGGSCIHRYECQIRHLLQLNGEVLKWMACGKLMWMALSVWRTWRELGALVYMIVLEMHRSGEYDALKWWRMHFALRLMPALLLWMLRQTWGCNILCWRWIDKSWWERCRRRSMIDRREECSSEM